MYNIYVSYDFTQLEYVPIVSMCKYVQIYSVCKYYPDSSQDRQDRDYERIETRARQ